MREIRIVLLLKIGLLLLLVGSANVWVQSVAAFAYVVITGFTVSGQWRKPIFFEWLVVGVLAWTIALFFQPQWLVSAGTLMLFLLGVGWGGFISGLPKSERRREYLLIGWTILGYVLGLLFLLVTKLSDYQSILFRTMWFTYGSATHFHIADLAVLASLLVVRSRTHWVFGWGSALTAMGGIGWGMSRTALLALLAGLYPAIHSKQLKKLLIGLAAFGFVLLGSIKPLWSSRPYFIQAIEAVMVYPVGVGVGNFGFISDQRRFQIGDNLEYSRYAHNYFLELLVGLGIFSIPLLSWWVRFAWKLAHNSKPTVLFWPLLLFFFFDPVYFSPFFQVIGIGALFTEVDD